MRNRKPKTPLDKINLACKMFLCFYFMLIMTLTLHVHLSDTQQPSIKRQPTDPTSEFPISIIRASKVNTNLPQEYELARFIEDMKNPDPSWNTSTPACEWNYVHCDDSQRVTKLDWKWVRKTHRSALVAAGILRWEWLPRTLLSCDVYHNLFTGPVSLDVLPPLLISLKLSWNKFTGSLDFVHLPPMLEELRLNKNEFEWRVDLTQLPQNLRHLDFSENNLSGHLQLSCLPDKMRSLNLSSNQFSGSLSLQHLPASLRGLTCSSNSFSGSVKFDSLPAGMKLLCLGMNIDLYGEIDGSLLPKKLKTLNFHSTKIVYKRG